MTYAHWLGLSTAEREDGFYLPCSRRLGLQVAAQAGGWLAQGQAKHALYLLAVCRG